MVSHRKTFAIYINYNSPPSWYKVKVDILRLTQELRYFIIAP